MKITYIIIFLCIFFTLFNNCKSYKVLNKDKPKIQCALLDSILSNSDVSKIIGLETAKNTHPCIRFFDETSKRFLDCNSIHFTKNKVAISYFVLPKISYYLNTGQYRDIVIYTYKEDKREIYLSLIVAHFENQFEKEGVPFFEFTFKKKDIGFYINKVKISIIREQLPLQNYYK